MEIVSNGNDTELLRSDGPTIGWSSVLLATARGLWLMSDQHDSPERMMFVRQEAATLAKWLFFLRLPLPASPLRIST
jgi:hypothetical protein